MTYCVPLAIIVCSITLQHHGRGTSLILEQDAPIDRKQTIIRVNGGFVNKYEDAMRIESTELQRYHRPADNTRCVVDDFHISETAETRAGNCWRRWTWRRLRTAFEQSGIQTRFPYRESNIVVFHL